MLPQPTRDNSAPARGGAAQVRFSTEPVEEEPRRSTSDRAAEASVKALRIYASYSPDQIMRRFTRNPEPLLRPETTRFQAAIGFVDISGFTALAEKLNKEYKRKGAELLNQYINKYFELLISRIVAHGGDVIKFAGDAMQVVWRTRADAEPVGQLLEGEVSPPDALDALEEAGRLPGLVLSACSCCLDLLVNLNEYSPVEGVVLKLHMGIGAGALDEFYVGGHRGKWEYFVAGEPIEQMSDATEEATHGQLVLSAYAYEQLCLDLDIEQRLEGQKLPSGLYRLERLKEGPSGAKRPSSEAPGAVAPRPLKRSSTSRELESTRNTVRMQSPVLSRADSPLTSPIMQLQAPNPELERVLRSFVPAFLEERIQGGQQGAWAAEHRKLVSVFMKILGLGLKPCEIAELQRAHEAVHAVQKSIARFDGTITRLICDDKGTRFLIAFGLPGHANEDDESRAILSSLEVVASLSQIPAYLDVLNPPPSPEASEQCESPREISSPAGKWPCACVEVARTTSTETPPKHSRRTMVASAPRFVSLGCAIGITTGRVFCGQAGSDERREYTLAGAKVNLAARLMQAAAKMDDASVILTDKDTRVAAGDASCYFIELPPIKVKGKEELVPIFQPCGLQTRMVRQYSSDRSEHSSGHLSRRSMFPSGSLPGLSRRRGAGFKTLGREREKLMCKEALECLNMGKSSFILFIGEAGMGKTHLSEWLRLVHLQTTHGTLALPDADGDSAFRGGDSDGTALSSRDLPVAAIMEAPLDEADGGEGKDASGDEQEESTEGEAAGAVPLTCDAPPRPSLGSRSSETTEDQDEAVKTRMEIVAASKSRASMRRSLLSCDPQARPSHDSSETEEQEEVAKSRVSHGSEGENAASLYAGDRHSEQMCFFMNVAKPIEVTTPFYLWRSVFERLFTTEALYKLAKRAREGSSSIGASRNPPQSPINSGKAEEAAKGSPQPLGATGQKRQPTCGDMQPKLSALVANSATENARDSFASVFSDFDAEPPTGAPEDAAALSPSKQSSAKSASVRSSTDEALKREAAAANYTAKVRRRASAGDSAPSRNSSAGPARKSFGHMSVNAVSMTRSIEEQLDATRQSKVRRNSSYTTEEVVKAPVHSREAKTRKQERASRAGERMASQAGVSLAAAIARWLISPHSSTCGPRQRWRDAYSTIQAYRLPSYELCGRHSIRPQADAVLFDDDFVTQLGPLLSPVLPIHIEDNDTTRHMRDEPRMEATLKLMVAVLTAKLGHSRVVLVFDDAHWMDSSSWALLRAVMKDVKPMLVVLTLRPLSEPTDDYEAVVKLAQDKSKSAAGGLVELPGLSKAEMHDLLRHHLNVDEIPDSLLHLIAERSDGNPFWAMEFIKSMQEGNTLSTKNGKCELKVKADELEFPSSVEALVTSRMDRLPTSLQLMMKMASVMGNEFTIGMLIFLAQKLELELAAKNMERDLFDTLSSNLRRLGQADMVKAESGSSARHAYSFKHKYLQDVAYSLLPEELKEKLHEAAAQFYEGRQTLASQGSGMSPSDRSGSDDYVRDERLGKLCHHWSKAGDSPAAVEKAVNYLKIAGDKALDNFSRDEARQLFSQALDIATNLAKKHADQLQHNRRLAGSREEMMRRNSKPGVVERIAAQCGPLQRRMGQCYFSKGEMQLTRVELQRALVSLGAESYEIESLSKSVVARKYSYQQYLYKVTKPKAYSKEKVKDPSGALERRIEQAIAYELLARVSMTEHERVHAGYCAMRALNIGLSLPTLHPVVARSYATLCLVESAKASGNTMVRIYKRRAMQACDALGELGQLTYTLQAAGVHYAGNARWKDAVESLSRAAEYSAQLRDKRQWEECISHQAHLEYYRGDFVKSKDFYEQAMASAEERDDKQIINRCRAGIAGVLLAQGDTPAALAILETTNSYGQLALCYLRQGKNDEALMRVMKVKDRFKGVRTKYYVLKAFASTSEVILKLLEDSQNVERRSRFGMSGRANSGSVHGGDPALGPDGFQDLQAAAVVSRSNGMRSSLSVLRKPVSRLSSLLRSSSKLPNLSGDLSSAPQVNAHSLNEIAVEWIEKLEQFGNIYPVAKPRALLLRGRYLFLQQRGLALSKLSGNSGLRMLRLCLQTAKSLQMPYEEGLARLELAKHATSKLEAVHQTEMALKFFTEVGAGFDAARCQEFLSTIKMGTITHSGRSFTSVRRLFPGKRNLSHIRAEASSSQSANASISLSDIVTEASAQS